MVNFNKLDKGIFKRVLLVKLNGKLSGRNRIIFRKSTKIVTPFLTYTFLVFKGCFYRNICISKFLLGFKFGEFSYTRKPFRYMLKSKKK